MIEVQFVAVLDATHKSLYAESDGERVLLAAVALSAIRDSLAARQAWATLCAACIETAELGAVQ